MAYRLLSAADAFWRPSNQMSVLNTDLGKQLEADALGARLWRLAPGQASTKHRHVSEEELYVLLEGEGRVRIDGEVADAGAAGHAAGRARHGPPALQRHRRRPALARRRRPAKEIASTLEMSEEQLRWMYPDGPKALPPELGG